MKKLYLILTTIVFLVLFTNPHVSSAAYNESSDQTISLTILDGLVQTDDTLGDVTFQLQEEAHSLLTNSTGAEVDHYYIWITLNGKKLLAIDPIKPSF